MTLRLVCTYPTRGWRLPHLLPTQLPEGRSRGGAWPTPLQLVRRSRTVRWGVRRANRIFTALDKGRH